MTLSEIKKQLEILSLDFNPSTIEEGKTEPEWWNSFNKDLRIMVSAHNDVIKTIKLALENGVTLNDLSIQDRGMIQPLDETKEPYHKYILVIYTDTFSC